MSVYPYVYHRARRAHTMLTVYTERQGSKRVARPQSNYKFESSTRTAHSLIALLIRYQMLSLCISIMRMNGPSASAVHSWVSSKLGLSASTPVQRMTQAGFQPANNQADTRSIGHSQSSTDQFGLRAQESRMFGERGKTTSCLSSSERYAGYVFLCFAEIRALRRNGVWESRP